MSDDHSFRALWAADEPPARDPAFTAATMLLVAERRGRRQLMLGMMRSIGLAAGAGGAAAVLMLSSPDSWTLASVACALAAAFWAGRRLFERG
jgi:hypothetical protein